MRRSGHLELAITLALALGACAAPPRLQSGPSAEQTHDGLTRVDNTVMYRVWLRPDIDLRGYDKIILEGAGMEFRPVKDVAAGLQRSRASATSFPISEKNQQRIRDIVTESFRESLGASTRFKLVSEPGPDVLLVRGALLDVASNVPPELVGRNEVYLSQIGEATLVIEVRDSTSGAILGRAVDRRAAEGIGGMTNVNAATTWSEVRRLATRWADQLRRGLEAIAGGALTAP